VSKKIFAVRNDGIKCDDEFNVERSVTADMLVNLNKWIATLKGISFTFV
jgi:hypothetical protein